MQKTEMEQKKVADVFEPLLDSQQAADLMHLHPESVKRLARTGAIIAAKVGGVWRFRVSALEAYMQKLTENTQNCPKYGTIGVSGWCRAELEKVMSQRARFQQGMAYRVKRKQGPDCWIFRWREEGADGKRVRRKVTLGTVKEYPTETSALKAAQVLRVTINAEQSQSAQQPFRSLLSSTTSKNMSLAQSRMARKKKVEHIRPVLLI
jgi:excisionase family DNA binding protein